MTPAAHEWHLITSAIDGDGTAFSSLYKRYLDASYRYFYFRAASALAAEKLADRLFVRVWESLPHDPELHRLPLKVWLFRLADRVVTNYNGFLVGLNVEHVRPPLIDWSLDIESSNLPRLHPRDLALAVRKLDPLAQQVIVLRFLLHFRHKDVALVVNDTAQAVSALQYRALATLCTVITRRPQKDNPFSGDHIEATNFCLDHIIGGTRTVEGCLQHLSNYNHQLQKTLQLAQMIVHACYVRPRTAFERGARQRIESQIAHSERAPKT